MDGTEEYHVKFPKLGLLEEKKERRKKKGIIASE
jgi:hypothetical protein